MGSIHGTSPSMTSRYVLKQAKSREEMDGIMDVIWAANYSPYDPLAQLIFPVLGFTPADREASLAESRVRFWQQHLADPSSNWFFVVDLVTGKPVGCAQWQIFTSNPFTHGVPKLTAPWWPEGDYRDFCELILNQVYRPRAHCLQRPSLVLNWMAVIPSHRRLGIGSLLMNEGISRADDLDLECWMEASSMGRPLYEKFGFRSVSKITFNTDKPDASDIWRKCQHEMTPPPITAMWRPKGAVWQLEGKGVALPWEIDAENATSEAI